MKLSGLQDVVLQRGGEVSLQQQLYQVLRTRILDGRYAAGVCLPASRLMAMDLGVSRNTVVLVLAQLESEGYIHSRRGAGTFVTDLIPDVFVSIRDNKERDEKPVKKAVGKLVQQGLINNCFAPGVPDLANFPIKIWKRIMRHHLDRTRLLGFESDQGYLPLRQAVSDYLRLSRGCVCSPEQIIITAGSQQAISLAASVLLTSGDQVYVENPGYTRARQALMAQGCCLKGLPVDEQGIITKNLPVSAQGKMLCLTPTHQYPMGGVLSLERRMEILAWSRANNIWLFEDDYDSEYHFYQKPVPAMQGLGLDLNTAQQVIYTGSFSKVIFPSLRLGYLLVPEELVEKFVQAKSHTSGESPLLEQAVTADFIKEGHFGRHILKMRKQYQEKLECLLSHAEKIPNIKIVTPGAGMHVVLLFTGNQVKDDKAFIKRLKRKGVNGNPLSCYYLGKAHQPGLVLGFANASKSEIGRGLKLIAEMIVTTQQ